MDFLIVLFVIFILCILTGSRRRTTSNRGPIVGFGRNPEIVEMERQEKEELKKQIIEKHGEDGYLWRYSVSLQDFLDGKKGKPEKVSVKEVLKEIDRPIISYSDE